MFIFLGEVDGIFVDVEEKASVLDGSHALRAAADVEVEVILLYLRSAPPPPSICPELFRDMAPEALWLSVALEPNKVLLFCPV